VRRVNTIGTRIGVDPRVFIGLALLLAGTLVWVFAFTGGLSSLFSGHTTVLRADFASIEDIVPNDPVRIDGVQVGTVASETPLPSGRGAMLTMDLGSNAGSIYANAAASILWRTLLGANDAVSINPGTRAAGLLGSRVIAQSRDSNQVELDQITQGALGGGAQAGTRTMVQQFAKSFGADPPLATDFGTLARIAPDAKVGIGALRGQIPDTDLKEVVQDSARAVKALDVGTSAAETRQFVQSAATTLDSVSASEVTLRATIVDAGQVLPEVPTTANALNGSLDRVDPLVRQLTSDAPQVAPTLSALHPAVVNAHALLRAATPLLHKLNPTVQSLAQTARVGVPVITAVTPSLKRLADTILPGLNKKGVEEGGHTEYEMVGPTFEGFAQADAQFDSDGALADFPISIEAQSEQLLPCSEDFSGQDFLVCDSLSQSLGEFLTGGTSLLTSLDRRPGGAKIYGPLLSSAQRDVTQLDATKAKLATAAPRLVQWLFDPGHGATP
jgi:ABC-type transporter Mla subunit MlaD